MKIEKLIDKWIANQSLQAGITFTLFLFFLIFIGLWKTFGWPELITIILVALLFPVSRALTLKGLKGGFK